MKNKLILCLALLCLALGGSASASGFADLYCQVGSGEAAVLISPQGVREESYLFLPAAADLNALIFRTGEEGETLDLSAGERSLTVTEGTPFSFYELCPDLPPDSICPVTITRDGERLDLKLLHSRNVAALYLTSEDPEQGRLWVEESKSNKAKGSVLLHAPDGRVIHAGALKQIRGRGNSTWLYPKRPYQIKLDAPADLLENGQSAGTWVLLANYLDKTLLNNTITYDLAAELNMPFSPRGRPVDLYYDGKYRGSYLLSEKTEVGENRVEIRDLEAAFQEANPEIQDLDALAPVAGTTPAGNPCQYVEGLSSPEDLSGGYLLEIDIAERSREEASWFASGDGLYLSCKSPEHLNKEAMDYISGLWQSFENALAAGGTDPVTGRSLESLMDLDSLALCYLLEELSLDVDAFRSSTYFYKPAGEDRFYAGPIWDFDLAYSASELPPTVLVAARTDLGIRLLSLPAFRQAVQARSGTVEALVRTILISNDPQTQGKHLRSLAAYSQELSASRRMDTVLWPDNTYSSYPQAVEALRSFLDQRDLWLRLQILGWTDDMVWSLDDRITTIFVDVPDEEWYAEPVRNVVDRGLFGGTEALHFSPMIPMNRAMTVTVLYRLAGQPPVEPTDRFSDVLPQEYYANAVAWAVGTGVVKGYPDGTFRPLAPVTRQEMVALLYRCAAPGETAPIPEVFTDRDLVADWAVDAFGWAIGQKLIQGKTDEILAPEEQTLRSQAAALFQRYCEIILESGETEASSSAPAPPATPDQPL